MYPYSNPSIISKGFGFLKSIKWGSILDSTGKTLGVINQAIPIIYQAKPLLGNMKTLFKIVNNINTNNNQKETIKETTSNNTNSNINKPIFYID